MLSELRQVLTRCQGSGIIEGLGFEVLIGFRAKFRVQGLRCSLSLSLCLSVSLCLSFSLAESLSLAVYLSLSVSLRLSICLPTHRYALVYSSACTLPECHRRQRDIALSEHVRIGRYFPDRLMWVTSSQHLEGGSSPKQQRVDYLLVPSCIYVLPPGIALWIHADPPRALRSPERADSISAAITRT